MKRTFLVKKDPTIEAQDNWLIMDYRQYAAWRETDEGKNREIVFGKFEACSEDDSIIFMECNEKVSKELKKDCHRKQYIRSRDAETPFQVMSYSTMTFQESEIYGEDVLEDTECNVEESVMQRMDIERVRTALKMLAPEERAIIQGFFFTESPIPVKELVEKYAMPKTSIYRKRDDALKKLKKSDPDVDVKLRDYMCNNFYDIRTFGAVMTTFVKAALNCGQVRGPVQIGFARSIDPIISQEVTITRVAITTEKDAENKSTEMGRKSIVPYGLYRAEGYISANLARRVTGFSEDDLELLWDAIVNMFENDHSAARGKMAVRELVVFKHSKELGDCPAYKLFDAVEVKKNEGVEYPRKYQDYTVTIHNECIPESVEVKRMI